MRSPLRRKVAMILAVAMLAAQLTACSGSGSTSQTTDPAGMSDVAVTVPINPDKAELAIQSAEAWLQENLGNIRQSLVAGEYTTVVETLEGMLGDLADNSQFNALLYIAYIANGETAKAAALLNNPNLNSDAFTQAVIEICDELQAIPAIAAAERQLMDHMMQLAQTNPDAYAAVARIGANLQNSNPNDPTVYAARYIAALAQGDTAAAEAVLAEAKEHGVTADTLSTAAAEYIEDLKFTQITVADVENGIATSTTYNVNGYVIKNVTTVTNEDGTRTEYVRDGEGHVVSEALFDASGNRLLEIHYTSTLVRLPAETMADKMKGVTGGKDALTPELIFSGKKEVITYKDGIPATYTTYLADGTKTFSITFDTNGNIREAVVYNGDSAEEIPKDLKDVLHFEIADGNIISITMPSYDEYGRVQKNITTYEYTSPVGVWTSYEVVDSFGNKVSQIEQTVNYDNRLPEITTLAETTYSWGVKLDSFTICYANGKSSKVTWEYYQYNSDKIALGMEMDYENHIYSEYDGKHYKEFTVADDDVSLTSGKVYIGSSSEGTLYQTYEWLYENGQKVGEKDITYYNGNVNQISKVEIFYFNQDGVIYGASVGSPIPLTVVYYNEAGQVTKEVERKYNENGEPYLVNETQYSYQDDGTVVASRYDFENGDPKTVFVSTTDSNGHLLRVKKYDYNTAKVQEQINYVHDAESGTDIPASKVIYSYNAGGATTQTVSYTYATDGVTETEKAICNYYNGNKKQEYVYSYNADGSKTNVTVYQYQNNEAKTAAQSVDYTYDEAGKVTSKKVTDYSSGVPTHSQEYMLNADGQTTSCVVTSYDADENVTEQKEIKISYLEDGSMASQDTYQLDGENPVLLSKIEWVYGENGVSEVNTYDYTDAENPVLVDQRVYDYTFNEDGSKKSVTQWQVSGENRTEAVVSTYAYDTENGTTQITEKAILMQKTTVQSYAQDGRLLEVQTYDDATNTLTASYSYHYSEDGALTGYTRTEYNADNTISVENYDPEGFVVEENAEKADAVMLLSEETAEEIDTTEPTEGTVATESTEDTEPAPTEESTEPAPTEESTEPTPTVESTEPAPTVESTEPAPTEESTEPAPTEGSAPAETEGSDSNSGSTDVAPAAPAAPAAPSEDSGSTGGSDGGENE